MAGEVESGELTDTPRKSPAVSDHSDVERPDLSAFDSSTSKYLSQNYRHAVGASYVLATGVCGIVLVALSSSLKDLASEVDKTSVQVGAVFLTRGVGAGLGNLVSSKLYRLVRGRMVVAMALVLLAATLLCVPSSGHVGTLHVNFLALGFLTAIIDSGCQLMTLRLHGSAAGPWLGANTVSFGVSGTAAPLIGWLTGSLMVQYCVLAAVTFCIAFFLVVLPRPDVQPPLHEDVIQAPELKMPEGWTKPVAFYEAHKVDFHLCGIMFWVMGGRVAATAFLRQFADDTSGSPHAPLLIVFLWLAISVGRVMGLRDQRTMTLARLYRHLSFVCVPGAIAMLVLLFVNRSTGVLWSAVVVYGLSNGPALGYGYDLSARVSPSPSTSTLVATFGITAGASVVPFLASFAWDLTGWAFFLPLFVLASHAVPLALVRNTKKQHGAASSNSFRRRDEDGDEVSAAAPTPTFGAPPSPAADWSPESSFEDEDGAGVEGGVAPGEVDMR